VCLGTPDASEEVYAAVTKLLSRGEMSDPKAVEAIRAESAALLAEDTWLESTVIEKDVLIAQTRKQGITRHFGEIMTICSIKFFECAAAFHKWKGRICFRGDITKDQNGALAVFQELSASPIAVQGINAALAYGCIPGHKSTTSDAVRAYLQSLLKTKHETWVAIPRVLWPKHWHGKYTKPMCLLKKALYGHPESGAHWERHLQQAIEQIGGSAIEDHPSSFWFKDEKILLSVYVDDLMLSGPEGAHDKLWQKLRSAGIKLDDPEPVDRFLGRTHIVF